MTRVRIFPLLAAFVAMLPLAAQGQAQGSSSVPPPKAPAEAPLTALQIQRDQLQTAIVKDDRRKAAELIRSGMTLDFDFDEGKTRGRTHESPLTIAIHRDRTEIVRMFLEAGADIRRRDGSGDAAIHAARNAEMVRLLVKAGADPNAPGRYGQTAVEMAIDRGNFEVLDALVASGARMDAPSRGADLFTRVVEAKKPELIGPLLQRGADPRSPPTKVLWPLIEKGDVANAKLLIQRGADPNAHNGREPVLLRALFRNQWEIAEALLDAGANLKIPDSPGCEKFVACESIQAIRHATFNPPFLRKLKARGIDLDVVSTSGHTALTSLIVERPMAIRAVSGGTAIGVAQGPGGQQAVTRVQSPVPTQVIPAPDNAARMKALLEAGADPNRKFKHWTPLMVLAGFHDKPHAMVDALIAAGGRIEFDAKIPSPVDDVPQVFPADRGLLSSGFPIEHLLRLGNYQGVLTGMRVGPLGWAVLSGKSDFARRLIERDRRIEPADRNLLYFAASAGDWDLVLAALHHSKEVNVSNRADVTPLMLAAHAGRSDVVRALLAAGADVNARSARSWPPLLERKFRDEIGGAIAGHSAAKPTLVGGYTALGAAKERGNAEVARILGEAGGRD